jgi:hypothetical protein
VTFLTLEFGTGTSGAAPLGDIAASLVSVDELLRDLASIAAYPATAEYRNIEVVGIEMRSPLKVTLSLFAISEEAVKAFQDICRDIMLYRERRGRHAEASDWDEVSASRLAGIKTALNVSFASRAGLPGITEQETERLYRHMLTLQNAEIPLRRVEVREE